MTLEETMNKEGSKIMLKNKTTEIIKSIITIKKER